MSDRHQFRAEWHSYNSGIYFITICCRHHKHYLGQITDGVMQLSQLGLELNQWVQQLRHNPPIKIINYVIMPNHLHMIISFETRDCDALPIPGCGCLRPKCHPLDSAPANFHHNSALARFIGNLKGGITRYARKNIIEFEWQSRYHDHILRDQHAFDNVMHYIDTNVQNWATDCFNPKSPRPRTP